MRVFMAVVVVATALLPQTASAQCTTNTDCYGDRICKAGQCTDRPLAPRPRVERPEAAALRAQMPGLHWPIASLLVGGVMFVVGLFTGVALNVGPLAGAFALGGGFTFAGVMSLATTLWARARLQDLLDSLER